MNKIYLNDELVTDKEVLKQFRISLYGNNNIIEVNDFFGKAIVYISIDGDNNTFILGKDNKINNDLSINFWNASPKKVDGSLISIGNNNLFNGDKISIISPLDKEIKIGDGNLFAGSITFWGRNDHIIYDIDTKERINNDRNIEIGDNNWICQNVSFLPGANILNNSVIGYGSIVNKKFNKNNILLAGQPAEIKKENVNWSRSSIYEQIDFNNNLNIKNSN